jgi:hypothetical protein
MVIFIVVIGTVVGWPVYVLISEQVTGGIHRSGQYYETNLKAMGNFTFDGANGTINDIPEQWRALDGKKLSLVGEIYAPNEATNELHRFELVYSIAKCCFGGPPKVQERVFCVVPNGKTAEWQGGGVYYNVKGTLHVNIKKEAGTVTAVYVLDVESVDVSS